VSELPLSSLAGRRKEAFIPSSKCCTGSQPLLASPAAETVWCLVDGRAEVSVRDDDYWLPSAPIVRVGGYTLIDLF